MTKKHYPLDGKHIQRMTQREWKEAKERLGLSYLVFVWILSRIYKAKKEGKNRKSAIIALFQFEHGDREEIKRELQNEVSQERLERDVPYWIPTAEFFDLMVKAFDEMEKIPDSFLVWSCTVVKLYGEREYILRSSGNYEKGKLYVKKVGDRMPHATIPIFLTEEAIKHFQEWQKKKGG